VICDRHMTINDLNNVSKKSIKLNKTDEH